MTKHDVAWRTEALRECWEQQLSPLECAQYIGVTRAQIYAIMAGREWKSIPRPEGFVYPFPAHAKQKKELTNAQKTEYIADYVRQRMSLRQFAEHIGLSTATASFILRGLGWKHIPRPEGFQYPWVKPLWFQRIRVPYTTKMARFEGAHLASWQKPG
jgi:plasmid maintenance system antidote protein VapI